MGFNSGFKGLTCQIRAVVIFVMTAIIRHNKLCSFVRIIPFHIAKHPIVANSSISDAISNMFTVRMSYSFAGNIGLY